MKLSLIGHNHKYQIESLIKIFFPTVRFSDHDQSGTEKDWVITRKKQGKHHIYLLAIACLNGKKQAAHFVMAQDVSEQEARLQLCAALYLALSRLLNRQLPWGMMTGIRPVKTVHQLMEQGNSPEQVRKILKTKYFVSDEKIDLCLKTFSVQQRCFVMECQPKVFSLYISIPFCPTRCSYCSFVSQAIATKASIELMREYVKNLIAELAVTGEIVKNLGLKLESVYFGGGTPTALSAELLEELFVCIQKHFDLSQLSEYTVEAGRPDTITREKLQVLKKYRVSRISINPQSFNDEVLRNVGRKHTAQDVIDCYQMARKLGISCINMDLIAGLPLESLESFQHSIDQAIALQPENITVHTLTIKRSSDFYAAGEKPNRNSLVAEMVSYAGNHLRQAGYMPYYLYRQKNMIDNLENVGYSKPGFESPYNVYIMEENQTILAVGAGAVTKLVDETGISRIFNYKYPYEYNNGFSEMIRRKQQVVNFYEK